MVNDCSLPLNEKLVLVRQRGAESLSLLGIFKILQSSDLVYNNIPISPDLMPEADGLHNQSSPEHNVTSLQALRYQPTRRLPSFEG
jgi:hypothetical protein